MRAILPSLLIFAALFSFAPVVRADDTMPPAMSNGGPSGTMPSGTTSVTLTLTTDEPARCKYATSLGVGYSSMPGNFTSATTTSHYAIIGGVVGGSTYDFYIRCIDEAGNATGLDYPIHFITAPIISADTAAPVITGGPSGMYAEGTRELLISLNTNENATCRYATSSKLYGSMTGILQGAGGSVHSASLAGLKDGTAYNYYVRCADALGNANASDYALVFTVATSTAPAAVPPPAAIVAAPPRPPAPASPNFLGSSADNASGTQKFVIKVTKNLRYGTQDNQVKSLQQFLIAQGFLKGTATGNFYAATEAAVKAFQAKHGLDSTGFVGPLTRAKINALQK